jgi:DNA processing protein
MDKEIRQFGDLPEKLLEINDPPKELNIIGEFPKGNYKYLAVVGSRKHTNYGEAVCEKIISELAPYPIVIISGLALGIDSVAHTTALKHGLKTIAIPGSGLSEKVLYPRSNVGLAKEIVKHGGCLLSEFKPDTRGALWTFPRRNRIMAGLSDAVLLIEAEEKSGTLITARLAMDYNRDVLVIPGMITSSASFGTNKLLKDGAHPCLGSKEVLEILGFKEQEKIEKGYDDCMAEEKVVLELLFEPKSKELLLHEYSGSSSELNTLLSLLEIKGHIKEEMGEIRRI